MVRNKHANHDTPLLWSPEKVWSFRKTTFLEFQEDQAFWVFGNALRTPLRTVSSINLLPERWNMIMIGWHTSARKATTHCCEEGTCR